jgi:hypothetical protein
MKSHGAGRKSEEAAHGQLSELHKQKATGKSKGSMKSEEAGDRKKENLKKQQV